MDAVNALADRLTRVHKPYAGARFRAAFLTEGFLRFLTGSVTFCPEEVPSRPIADYGSLVLVEQWQGDQGEALALFSRVLSGQADIAGQKVGSGFRQSDLEHRPYTFGSRMWSGWEMRSYYDPSDPHGHEQPLAQDAVLGFGLKPYLGGNQAINDWVFDVVTDSVGGTVSELNALVTFLPDTRARVVSALWTPGKLGLRLEINVPTEEVELQIIHSGRSGRTMARSGLRMMPTFPWSSGRAMARTGLRMMPTFPSLPLKFRTAGFPQYG